MDAEYAVKAIPIDDNLPQEVERLSQEGWQMIPTVQAVAIYHLVRFKNQATVASGMGKLGIDDSKVFVIPAAKREQG